MEPEKTFLIHSSLRFAHDEKRIAESPPLKQYTHLLDPWPLGRVIGAVTIGRIIPTAQWKDEIFNRNDRDLVEEHLFGDYTDGRYAFELTAFKKFDTMVNAVGALSFWDFDERICLSCGCTDRDCSGCVEKTGRPCHWISENFCSRCAGG